MSRWFAWENDTFSVVVDNVKRECRVVYKKDKATIPKDAVGIEADVERELLRMVVADLAQQIRGYR